MTADFDISSSFIPSLYKPASLLPITRHKNKILYLVENHAVTVVVGQTGSGKTTQIPQFLEQAGWCSDGKVIGVTQVCGRISTFARSENSIQTPHSHVVSLLRLSQLE